MGDAAWVFFLEAGLALGLLVFIVWWTMGSRAELQEPPKTEEESKRPDGKQE
ncbi:hypothetical protein V8J88_02300 [Massilia sp. W12]|uniref:hypothetical protein n=1 Tax=Massilia sp. W12 TaxID=3126507 RepID=UPI0030D21B52